MVALRKIEAIAGVGGAAADWRVHAGKPPFLAFIPISKLVVEHDYQRVIGKQGSANIKKIVRNFRWSRFAPIIVAPIEGGLFAIIDGQHRATALATLGEDAAPAVVYEIDLAARADAFAALNISVTSLSAQARFFAVLHAGDETAGAVARVCKKHRVDILKFNMAADQMKGRQSAAAAAMLRVVQQYGEDVLSAAIRLLTTHPDYKPGYLGSQWISATSIALAEDLRLFRAIAKASTAFGRIDLESEWIECCDDSRGRSGVSARRLFADLIKRSLQRDVIASKQQELER